MNSTTRLHRCSFSGIPVGATTFSEAVDAVTSASKSGTARDLHFCNAYTLSLASDGSELRAVLVKSWLNLPDGHPLARLLSRMAAPRPAEQIRGPAFFEAAMDHGRSLGLRHFLLGGSPETLMRLHEQLESRFPGVVIAGTLSPPFRSMSAAERSTQDDLVRESRPDVVWVGLGTPRQDFEASRIAAKLDVCAVAIGAAFDFTAGTKPVAPALLQRLGLEWAFRLVTEPRRLWRRYLIGNGIFVGLATREMLRHRRRRGRA